jgi:bifunctional non-homologous end joining protein LigD
MPRTRSKSAQRQAAPAKKPSHPKTAGGFAALPKEIRLTHPERVVYKNESITKGDVARYFFAAAERMLPYVANRPLSTVRCPEGDAGECFFQKHPPMGMPDFVERVRIREKSGMKTYLAVHDAAGILALIQFGALEIHTWGSRADDFERPDQIIFDLDPGPNVAWERMIDAAQLMRKMLKQLGLETFLKTTGGKGLHVVAPIQPKHEWPAVKSFCRGVAETLSAARPRDFLSKMTKAARVGRIFVDYLRNDRGSTAIAPYSTRSRPGAPIAVPISWRELSAISGGGEFTILNIAPRLKPRAKDAWADFQEVRQSLPLRLPKVARRRTIA